MTSAGKLPATRWQLREVNRELEDLLVRELGLNPIVSRIITSRDISDPELVRRYLSPSLQHLHNPFLMQDMDRAVDRLLLALHRDEKIVVYGDYDADGITSVASLVHFLRKLSPGVCYHIPDRITEGYGLSRSAVDRFRALGAALIVTVDCGITDHDAVGYAKRLGIDTVVLDHHELADTLPPAVAAVNPKRTDCRFPFKHLAAVGIVFNFLIAMRGALRREGFWRGDSYPNLRDYLDLVALGTIGDIVPLIDENRIFVKVGLQLITEEKRVGLRALKQVAGITDETVDSGKASFALIPRINAAGRIAQASLAAELLLSEDQQQADDLARKLDGFNRKRQAMEKAVFNEILELVTRGEAAGDTGPLVFASPNWHPGILGIVASRLVDRFGRLAILFSLKDGIGKGSGRSVSDFNIYDGLRSCQDHLLSFGGHQHAAGISIREEQIAPFSSLLCDLFREQDPRTDRAVSTTIDAQCALTDITHEFLSQIAQLAPFGSRNPEPVLCVRDVRMGSLSVVGNNHLKMKITHDGVSRNSIWFGSAQYLPSLCASRFDIVFTPQINTWNGHSDIQLKMRDVAVPAAS